MHQLGAELQAAENKNSIKLHQLGAENDTEGKQFTVIIPRGLGKEGERLGKETQKLGKERDDFVKRLGKKAEKLGIKLGKSKVDILWMMYQNPTITTMEILTYRKK